MLLDSCSMPSPVAMFKEAARHYREKGDKKNPRIKGAIYLKTYFVQRPGKKYQCMKNLKAKILFSNTPILSVYVPAPPRTAWSEESARKSWDPQTQHSASVARLLSTFFKSAPSTKKSVATSGHGTPRSTPSSGGSPTTCKRRPASPSELDSSTITDTHTHTHTHTHTCLLYTSDAADD